MNTWYSHFSRLVKELGYVIDFLYSKPGIGIREELIEYLKHNDPLVLIVGRDRDWMQIKDIKCNKWFYMHNAYQICGHQDHTDDHDNNMVHWNDFIGTLDKVLCPTRYIADKINKTYIPQPYMSKNIKVEQQTGVLMIGTHPIKQHQVVADFYQQHEIQVTVLHDGFEEVNDTEYIKYKTVELNEIQTEIQKHKILVHNSEGETGCYALLEANGIIPTYVNENYEWSKDFLVPTNRIDMKNLLDVYNNPEQVPVDVYRDHVIKAWSDFLTDCAKCD